MKKSKNSKEENKSPEAQEVLAWCKKRKVICHWVLSKIGSDKVQLCMNRKNIFVYSNSMPTDYMNSITFDQMKELLIDLIKQLKQKEE